MLKKFVNYSPMSILIAGDAMKGECTSECPKDCCEDTTEDAIEN